jgi:hypothetical protein
VPGPDDAEVVYLFDPADDPADDPGPVSATPTGLFGLLARAVDAAGLVEVKVTAAVSGYRRPGGRWASFDLVDQAPGAAAPDARLRVVVFARVLAGVDRDLARAVPPWATG